MLGRLAARHSCAIIEACERGLSGDLAREFDPGPYLLSRVLTCCDMKTSPDGKLVPAESGSSRAHRPHRSQDARVPKSLSMASAPVVRIGRSSRRYTRALERDLASFTSPSDLNDLHATLDRYSDERTADIRRILAARPLG
jgi:hypothetical protein